MIIIMMMIPMAAIAMINMMPMMMTIMTKTKAPRRTGRGALYRV